MNTKLHAIDTPTPGVWTEVATDTALAAQVTSRLSAEKATTSSSKDSFALAVKANIGVSGFTRSAGCRVFTGQCESADAPVVAALRAAGAVVVGTTNMHELAFGITSNNAAYGPVRLPGHEDRGAGGSSGGSAAAVAEGSVDIALGTDTGGSVSIPASHCGVYGFRPTRGRWPSAGIIGLSWTRDTAGVFTRRLEDAVRADTWITGDNTTQRSARKLRLGIPRQFTEGLDPHTANIFDQALTALRDQATVIDIDFADVLVLTRPAEMPTVLWEARRLLRLVTAEALNLTPQAGFEHLAHHVASPDVAAILHGECQTPTSDAAYQHAQWRVARAQTTYAELVTAHDVDVLVFPATPAPAPPVETTDTVHHLGQDEGAFHLYTRHTGQGTILAAPMVTIPLPVPAGALPVGLTVQGPRFADRKTLSVAEDIDAWSARPERRFKTDQDMPMER